MTSRSAKSSRPSGGCTANLLDDLRFERGTFDDYKALARFHYKAGRPSPSKAVFRIIRDAPTVVGRYLSRRNETQLVGVLVRSLPRLSCQMRDVATNFRYRGLKRRDAAAMLNREVRTISRVVIDPQWRGLGLAVKLVRFALDHPHDSESHPSDQHRQNSPFVDDAVDLHSPLFTEALAAMGRVSPFFERAGMTRYDRPPRPEHARLLDALRHLQIEPYLLASPSLLKQQLATSDDEQFLIHELRIWRRAALREINDDAVNAMDLDALLADARDQLLASPVYYLFQHDAARAPSQQQPESASTQPLEQSFLSEPES